MSWDYAELAKAAKSAGGPEKLLDLIKESGKYLGRIEGRASMVPWIVGAILVTAGITYGATKLIDLHRAKMAAVQLATEEAKKELICKLIEHDAMHTGDDSSTEEGEDDNE